MATVQWRQAPISSLCEALHDGPHATPKPAKTGPIFLGIKNITEEGALDLSEIRHIAEEDYARWTRRVEPRAGDIVFTYEATLNRYAIIPDGFRGCLGRRLGLIRPDLTQVDPRFLFYYFFSDAWRRVISHNTLSGSTVDRISLARFGSFPVNLPPLPEQQRIAGILSAYDELIENCRRRIRLLEELARSPYREWFVHFRHPGHDSQSAASSIPEGWVWRKLGDLASEVRRNVPKGDLAEPQPYVGLEQIPRRSLVLDDWQTATRLGSSKLAFQQGDVLFGKIRPYFHKVSVAPFAGLCSADTIVIRTKEAADNALVAACVSTDDFVAHAAATSNGSKMPRASWRVLAEYPVLYPDAQTLRRFSEHFHAALAQQQTLLMQTRNLRATRELLLPRLFASDPGAFEGNE